MSDIDIYQPKVIEITIDGQVVRVEPLRFKQYAVVYSQLAPLLAVMQQDPTRLTGDYADATAAFVATACNVEKQWVEDRRPEDVVALVGAALEVNGDFLRSRMVPAIIRLRASINLAFGLTSSSPLERSESDSPKPGN